MRVVCDTNILASSYPDALGPSRRLLDMLRDGPHQIVLSAPMLDEPERTLAYPHLQKRWRTAPEKIRRYRAKLEAIAQLTVPAEGPRILPGGPDDDLTIYTAVAGSAEVICTRDPHFRQPDVLQFCQRRDIRILSDLELLDELGAL
jgi:putative PIN family toxin of toxin-antitoxin system